MTGGGPGTKTTTLSIYMYKQAFGSYQMGYGTAIALVMLIIGIIMCVVSMGNCLNQKYDGNGSETTEPLL